MVALAVGTRYSSFVCFKFDFGSKVATYYFYVYNCYIIILII